MRNPNGVLRDLFFQLYSVCFEVEMVAHCKKHVIMRTENASGQEDFVILLSWTVEEFKKIFGADEIPHFFAMAFAGPEHSETKFTLDDADDPKKEYVSKTQYFINVDRINNWYHLFIRPHKSARDAMLVFEASSMALLAHEIRHQLQIFEVVSKEKWYTMLLPPKEVRLSATITQPSQSVSREYRRYFKIYGKYFESDRERLAMEIDAFSVQLQSFYSWTESKGLPLKERLERIRDIIFSEA